MDEGWTSHRIRRLKAEMHTASKKGDTDAVGKYQNAIANAIKARKCAQHRNENKEGVEAETPHPFTWMQGLLARREFGLPTPPSSQLKPAKSLLRPCAHPAGTRSSQVGVTLTHPNASKNLTLEEVSAIGDLLCGRCTDESMPASLLNDEKIDLH